MGGRLGTRERRKRPTRSRAARGHPAARRAAAHRHTDAGPDQAVCLLCGETFRAIRVLRLRRIHGFEGPHPVEEYKEMLGLRVASCEETCEGSRQGQIARHRRAGRHWTKTRLLREIRRRRNTPHGLASSCAPVPLKLAARRMFGGWDEALRAAGVDPDTHRLTRAWSAERITAGIRRIAATCELLTATRIHRDLSELHRAAIRAFGNWGAALRAAGLDPARHREPKRWCMPHVLEWVRAIHAAGGDVRSSMAPHGALQRVHAETTLTWSEFVESLGIPYPGRRKRLDWTDAAVLAAIRKRRRRGLPLNRKAVYEDGGGLVAQATRRFGSWDAALRAAGFAPDRIRRTRASAVPRGAERDPAGWRRRLVRGRRVPERSALG